MKENMNSNVQKILNAPKIPQKSQEWLSFRKMHLTASDAHIIVGNGVKGKESLFLTKTNQKIPFGGNEHTQLGACNETKVLEEYQKLYPDSVIYTDLYPVVHPVYNEFAASLDAVTDSGVNVEFKYLSGTKIKNVPKTYKCQVLFQMECTSLEMTHLVQYYYELDKLVVTEFKRDQDWFEMHKDKMLAFVHRVREYREVHNVIEHGEESKSSFLVDRIRSTSGTIKQCFFHIIRVKLSSKHVREVFSRYK